jgi:hypothetical protein
MAVASAGQDDTFARSYAVEQKSGEALALGTGVIEVDYAAAGRDGETADVNREVGRPGCKIHGAGEPTTT